jgi:phosphoribosylamine--glycine ligase
MNILVVGGGGREHAIIKKLRENPKVDKIFALPGNGGIALQAQCLPISPLDIKSIVEFAKSEDIDYAVVAPDDPLVLGAVDELEKIGIPCFGPDKRAAIIEGSKVFAKKLMKKYNIPTAAYEVFDNSADALEYLENSPLPCVIKADGLAAGKGVIIAQTLNEAKTAVCSIMEEKSFGESGNRIVIEEFLTGPEVSVLSFTDGKAIVPMVSSMDHKRILDGDKGLNTGGMGAIAPNPFYTEETAQRCMREIFLPTISAMNIEGRTFKGCLYFGLMLTKSGPKVIEYNCRFGDPEAQVVLPLLKTDLLTIMRAVSDGRLSDIDIQFSGDAACCVILASKGYPLKYATGYTISIPKVLDGEIFIGGAVSDGGILRTSSGRVLGITATASCLEKAVRKAYDLSAKITFKDKYLRSDIGKKALEVKADGSQGLC